MKLFFKIQITKLSLVLIKYITKVIFIVQYFSIVKYSSRPLKVSYIFVWEWIHIMDFGVYCYIVSYREEFISYSVTFPQNSGEKRSQLWGLEDILVDHGPLLIFSWNMYV